MRRTRTPRKNLLQQNDEVGPSWAPGVEDFDAGRNRGAKGRGIDPGEDLAVSKGKNANLRIGRKTGLRG